MKRKYKFVINNKELLLNLKIRIMELFSIKMPINKFTLTSDESKQISDLEEKAFWRRKMSKSEWSKLSDLRAKHLLSLDENPNEWHLDKRRLKMKKKI